MPGKAKRTARRRLAHRESMASKAIRPMREATSREARRSDRMHWTQENPKMDRAMRREKVAKQDYEKARANRAAATGRKDKVGAKRGRRNARVQGRIERAQRGERGAPATPITWLGSGWGF